MLADESEDREYRFSVLNDDWDETNTFDVRILNVDGDVLVDETYELEPNEHSVGIHLGADPSEPNQAPVPSSIHVTLNDTRFYIFGWPASPEEKNRLARRADVHYDPSSDQELRVWASDFEP